MKIQQKGLYIANEIITIGNNHNWSSYIPKGEYITINQIDHKNQRVNGPELGSWQSWFLPVKIIKV